MSADILAETIDILRHELGAKLDAIVIERAVIGIFFTGVKLSTGHAGVCATPIKEMPEAVCCPSSAGAAFNPFRIKGMAAAKTIADIAGTSGIERALAVATVNALADLVAERRAQSGADLGAEVIENMDAFDAADVTAADKAVVIGAFAPFLRELRKRGTSYWVLEKDPSTLKPIELPFFRPAQEAAAVVPDADVVFITGTTLVNDTLDTLVALAKPSARLVVAGPTVTMLPDAFFARRCDILGGVKITDPDSLLDVLALGGSGYHFFGRFAEKIVLRRKRPAAAIAA
jgi:uncharacterized protein (DUF4213/DUF364 family)